MIAWLATLKLEALTWIIVAGGLGDFLMDPSMRGQGIGQVAMRVIENQFFGNELLHRFELLVATDNLPAIACYQKVGFQTEGILRESRRFGNEWRAVQIMGLLRHEWEEEAGK